MSENSTWLGIQLLLLPSLKFSWILSVKTRLPVLAFSKLFPGDGIILEKDN